MYGTTPVPQKKQQKKGGKPCVCASTICFLTHGGALPAHGLVAPGKDNQHTPNTTTKRRATKGEGVWKIINHAIEFERWKYDDRPKLLTNQEMSLFIRYNGALE